MAEECRHPICLVYKRCTKIAGMGDDNPKDPQFAPSMEQGQIPDTVIKGSGGLGLGWDN